MALLNQGHVWVWDFCLLTVFTEIFVSVLASSCQHLFLFSLFARCVYLPPQPAWLLSCSPRRGVVCWSDRAWPAHLWTVEEWKENVIFPGSGQLRRPASNLYQHLSPINPALNQLRRSENLLLGTIGIPPYRTRKERPDTLSAGETVLILIQNI